MNASRLLQAVALPGFSDPSIERDFRRYVFRYNRSTVRIGLVLALVFFAVLEPTLRLWFPSNRPVFDGTTRWMLHVPLVLVCLVQFERKVDDRWLERCFLVTICFLLFSNSLLLWSAALPYQSFYVIAVIQVMIYAFFLTGLRFRVVFPPTLAVITCTAFFYVLFRDSSANQGMFDSPYLVPLLVYGGVAFAAFSLDQNLRQLFLAERSREQYFEEALDAEEQRIAWLTVATNYLHHEVKNALLAVHSSLLLIRRRDASGAFTDYVQRADQGVEYMRRLLREVSASSSLELALAHVDMEPVDVSELLAHRVEAYRSMFPECGFVAEIVPTLTILGDGDKLVQALDNVVENAIRHAREATPITLTLKRCSDSVVLTVSDEGDPLPETEANIFAPFSSHREGRDSGQFGLGLYVAYRIVEAHGGDIAAHPLTGTVTGAAFVITLPVHAAGPDSV